MPEFFTAVSMLPRETQGGITHVDMLSLHPSIHQLLFLARHRMPEKEGNEFVQMMATFFRQKYQEDQFQVHTLPLLSYLFDTMNNYSHNSNWSIVPPAVNAVRQFIDTQSQPFSLPEPTGFPPIADPPSLVQLVRFEGASRLSLADIVNRAFTLEEFQDLCFRLNVRFDNVAGGTLQAKVLSLIGYYQARQSLGELEVAIRLLRPTQRIDAITEESRPVLHAAFVEGFNETELRDFCVEFGVDYDQLAGREKAGKMRELILYCERRGIVGTLVDAFNQSRPNTHIVVEHTSETFS